MPITRVPLYYHLTKKIKRMWSIEEVAKENKLAFTRKEETAGSIVALDSKEKKLLFCRRGLQLPSCLIIDLKSLKRCTLVRQYGKIKAGALPGKKMQDYLTGISLCLHFETRLRPVSLPFYEAGRGGQEDAFQTERRARAWKGILSQLLLSK